MNGCTVMKCKYWDGKTCISKHNICLYQTEETGIRQLEESLVHIKNVLEAAIARPDEIAKDWKERLILFMESTDICPQGGAVRSLSLVDFN